MGRGVFGKYGVCRFVSLALLLSAVHALAQEKHFLYVAVPGIRNYVEYGGIGILVDGARVTKAGAAQARVLHAGTILSTGCA